MKQEILEKIDINIYIKKFYNEFYLPLSKIKTDKERDSFLTQEHFSYVENSFIKFFLKMIFKCKSNISFKTIQKIKDVENTTKSPFSFKILSIFFFNYFNNPHIFDLEKSSENITNEKIIALKQYINYLALTDEELEFFYCMICQKINFGVSMKTFEKYDFLPNESDKRPMKAKKLEEKTNIVLEENEKIYITEKIDGFRCYYHKMHNTFYSKEGNRIEGFNYYKNILYDLIDEFVTKNYSDKSQKVLQIEKVDGELIHKSNNFKLTSSIIKTHGEKDCNSGIIYKIFDIGFYDVTHFITFVNDDKKQYHERRKILDAFSIFLKEKNIECIQVVPVEEIYDKYDYNQIILKCEQIASKGKEGIMLNLGNSCYEEDKRSKGIWKVKLFQDDEFKCIGVNPGEINSKFENTLGSITIDVNGKEVLVPAFSDEDRALYWANPELIIGKMVTVKYFHYTEDGSLRHPSFKAIRY